MLKNLDIKIAVTASVYLAFGVTVLECLCNELHFIDPLYLTVARYVSILYVLYFTLNKNIGLWVDKPFFMLYLVYSLYILVYLTIDKQIPLEKMLRCPESVTSFLLYSIYLLLFILCSKTIVKYISLRLICILFLIFTLIPSLYYINIVGFQTMQVVSVASSEQEFIGALTFSYACSMVFVINLFFYKSYTPIKILNLLILGIVICGVIYVWMAGTKRGPMLWAIVSSILCYMFKTGKATKFIVRIFIIGGILYFLIPFVLDYFKDLAPYTIERINAALYEGDTSSRLDAGNSNSGYVLAFNQYLDSPILGSYFRILKSSPFYGVYPHNIFLEIMITMGGFGLVAFFYIFKRLYVSSIIGIGENKRNKQMFFFVIFNMSFFTLFTTDTILLNYSFWISLGYVLVYPRFANSIEKTQY